MLRTSAFMLFSLAIGSAFLLKMTHLPDSFIWFAIACIITGAILITLIQIRSNGIAISVGGLFLIYFNAPEPSALLTNLLVFIATLMITATGLLIASDLSAIRRNQAIKPKGSTCK
jgi:hypothetical protein